MSEETPQEKARRMGIPLIAPIDRIIPKRDNPATDKSFRDAMLEHLSKPVAICGGCGKEMLPQDAKSPCGRQDCPFGYIQY